MGDLSRLKVQLATSGLQEKNQALYQVINQLIDAGVTTQNNGVGSPGPPGPTGPAGIAAVPDVTILTGVQNNLVILPNCTYLRCNNATLLTINGIAAGFNGQVLDIASVGAGQVNFAHQNGGSAAANRLINYVTSGLTPLFQGVGNARFVYDGTTARWRMINHCQGDFITSPFNAADFTSSAGSWTVAAGDRAGLEWYLKERKITVAFQIDTTTVAGGPLFLQIGNGQWGGFTAGGGTTGVYGSMGFTFDNLVSVAAYVRNTTGITIDCGLATITAWANSTDQTYVRGTIEFQVT